MKLNVAALAVLASASAVLAIPQPEADNHRGSYGYKDVDYNDYDYDYYRHNNYNSGRWYNSNEWYYDGSRWYYFDKFGKKIFGEFNGDSSEVYKREAAPEAEAVAEPSNHKHEHKNRVFWNGQYWYYEDGRYFYFKHGRKVFGHYHGPKFWKHKSWKRETAPEAEAVAEAAAEPSNHKHEHKNRVFWNGQYWYYEDGRYFYFKHGRKVFGRYHGPQFWKHKSWKREAAPEAEAVAEAEPVAEPSNHKHEHEHKFKVFWNGRIWYYDGRYYYLKHGRRFYGKYFGPKFGRH